MICSFYFVWVVILVRIVRDLVAHIKTWSSQIFRLCFVLYLLLFNFQWPMFVRRFAPTLLLYHNHFRLSRGFWKVFWDFLKISPGALRSVQVVPEAQWLLAVTLPAQLALFSSLSHPKTLAVITVATFLRRPFYYTTRFPFCQAVFWSFFQKTFQRPWRRWSWVSHLIGGMPL